MQCRRFSPAGQRSRVTEEGETGNSTFAVTPPRSRRRHVMPGRPARLPPRDCLPPPASHMPWRQPPALGPPHSERVLTSGILMSRCVIAQPRPREDPSVIHEIYVARKQPKTLTAFGKQLSYAFFPWLWPT